jgi:DoxX-like family
MLFTTFSILLAALCLMPSFAKLSAQPAMQASADHFGIEWPRYRLIGVAELVAAIGLLAGLAWHPLGVATTKATGKATKATKATVKTAVQTRRIAKTPATTATSTYSDRQAGGS